MLTVTKREPSLDIEDDMLEYSFDKCRICLKSGDIAIFGAHNILSNIVEFGSITISEQDNFPKYLCDACHLLLEAAVLFRQTAKKTDTLLRMSISKKYIDDNYNSDIKILQAVNEKLENKLKLITMQSEYQGNVSDEIQHECEQLDNQEFIMESSLNENYSSVDDAKTEKEYLVVNESDEENKDILESKEEGDIFKAETYMIIVSDENEQKKKDTGEEFTCDLCFVNFKTIGKLENHIELEHNIKKTEKVNCAVCNEIISQVLYSKHMKLHREKYKQKRKKGHIKIECKICNKIVNKTYYKYHLKLHGTEEERTRPCMICNKFISASYYNDHLKRMHRVGPYGEKLEDHLDHRKQKLVQCLVCDKKIRESKYNNHLAQHGRTPKKYICEHCAKVFIHYSAFKTHCLTHGGEMKYSCQFCPYKAQHLGLLKVHVRTHTGDYNYKCTKCPARFITKSNLNQHLRRHNGPGDIKCYSCDKTFYRKLNMEEHYKTIHLGIKDVICNTCGKGFSHRDRMLSHQLKVHKRERLLPRVPTYLKIANEGKTVYRNFDNSTIK